MNNDNILSLNNQYSLALGLPLFGFTAISSHPSSLSTIFFSGSTFS